MSLRSYFPAIFLGAILVTVPTSAFAQVGPDIDSILANQKAAEEARRKERAKEDAAQQEAQQQAQQRVRAEIRAEVTASTQATDSQLQSEVTRLRAELAEARKTIELLTVERDSLRRIIDATTRPSH